MIPRLRRILWRIEDKLAPLAKEAVILISVCSFWAILLYLLIAGEFK